jgi:hypothetical protein
MSGSRGRLAGMPLTSRKIGAARFAPAPNDASEQSLLGDAGFIRRLETLSGASDAVWLVALTIGLGFTLVGAFGFAGSPSGKFWAYAGLLIRGSLYLWAGDALRTRGGEVLRRLFVLGLVAGAFELLVDWVLIHWVPNGKLVYLTDNDVVLLGSPVWMPLAWACVIVELGYPALRIFAGWRLSLGDITAAIASSSIIGVAAGFTVGFYEYFAYRAGWWRYEPAHAMIGQFCAVYIPLGELLMFLAVIPVAAHGLGGEERRTARGIEAGALFAVAIAAGYGVAYLLLEAGRAP